jgi:hypothetical protein
MPWREERIACFVPSGGGWQNLPNVGYSGQF